MSTMRLPSSMCRDRVELEPAPRPALFLRGHDERPAYVAVLYQPLRDGYAGFLRIALHRASRGVRDRDHEVRLDGRARASALPRLWRTSYTHLPSILESGREKYTYSNMQWRGSCRPLPPPCASRLPCSPRPPRPGARSPSSLQLMMSSATLSDANTILSSLLPQQSGRIACGSRNATSSPSCSYHHHGIGAVHLLHHCRRCREKVGFVFPYCSDECGKYELGVAGGAEAAPAVSPSPSSPCRNSRCCRCARARTSFRPPRRRRAARPPRRPRLWSGSGRGLSRRAGKRLQRLFVQHVAPKPSSRITSPSCRRRSPRLPSPGRGAGGSSCPCICRGPRLA